MLSDMESSYWDSVIAFYESSEMADSIEIKTARLLSRSRFAESWFPSTSHMALVISPTSDYKETEKFPLIAVKGRDRGQVELEVWRRHGDTNSFSRVLLNDEDSLNDRLISFLETYEKACEH